MKDIKGFFKSMLSRGGISSKRFAGLIILSMLCWAYVYCTIREQQMPNATDWFIGLVAVLLGLDTVVKPFHKTNENNE